MKKLYKIGLSILCITLITWLIPANPVTTAGTGATLAAQDEEPSLSIGGALRYNVLLTSYESDIEATDGAFTLDTWRLNAVYNNPGGISMNFEYRFYPTFGTHFIKQGWLEYDFSPRDQIQLGVTQVPFGNLAYNSNSWWFSLAYYVGLEDDHDAGLKYTRMTDSYRFDVAYFYQPEPEGPVGGAGSFGSGGSGRYSYDVIPGGSFEYAEGDELPNGEIADEDVTLVNAPLTERNQFNLRYARLFDAGEVGASFQFGQLYNSALDEFSGRFAAAVHGDFNVGGIGIKPQFAYYSMDAENDEGEELSTVFMGAYGIPYEVSTEAWIATLGLSRSVDIDVGPFTNITFYNDFSYQQNLVGEGNALLASVDEDTGVQNELNLEDNFEETIQNITGFALAAGPLYTYFDIAQGVNQPWLTDSFGTGVGPGHEDLGLGDSEYNIRFNINIGYYF